jgi:hypothetical protein
MRFSGIKPQFAGAFLYTFGNRSIAKGNEKSRKIFSKKLINSYSKELFF